MKGVWRQRDGGCVQGRGGPRAGPEWGGGEKKAAEATGEGYEVEGEGIERRQRDGGCVLTLRVQGGPWLWGAVNKVGGTRRAQ